MSESLTEFLLARIAEDEAAARVPFDLHWTAHPDETGQPIKAGRARVATCAASVMPHIARHDPARVLAECEAKRRIVEAHRAQVEDDDSHAWIVASRVLLRALALPYADHPDFQEAWRA